MKISNKQEFQQNAFKYSSDTGFKPLYVFIKNLMENHIFVIDPTLT